MASRLEDEEPLIEARESPTRESEGPPMPSSRRMRRAGARKTERPEEEANLNPEVVAYDVSRTRFKRLAPLSPVTVQPIVKDLFGFSGKAEGETSKAAAETEKKADEEPPPHRLTSSPDKSSQSNRTTRWLKLLASALPSVDSRRKSHLNPQKVTSYRTTGSINKLSFRIHVKVHRDPVSSIHGMQ